MATTPSNATALVTSARMEAICNFGETRGMQDEPFEVVVQAWTALQKTPTSAATAHGMQ